MESLKTLIVCEKPDAAARVARALDEEGIPRRRDQQGVGYFECSTRDDSLIVCSALGHLYAVNAKGHSSGRAYPVWDFGWKPRHEVDRGSRRLARRVSVINALARECDRFINACDYDIEGSLIGHTILRFACNGAESIAQRMKFSTMTEKELKNSFRSLLPQLDVSLVEAGRCRHELDWVYGINLSRVMTGSVVKQKRGYATLSTGRVQGPTLAFVVSREEEIGCFVPTPFWTIDARILIEGREYAVEYYKDQITSVAEANEVVSQCEGRLLEVKDIVSQKFQQLPPFPFDLSGLQFEAYRHFGYTPARTLAAAERLYLNALISYPRTSSQKLPPDIGYEGILRGLSAQDGYRLLAAKLLSKSLRPTHGPKDDPAHPAIYPTGERPARTIVGPEARLYDLVVRRFMSTFASLCLRQSNRVTLENGAHKFFSKGSKILEAGWTEFYHPYVSDDTLEIPTLTIGMEFSIQTIAAREKFTQPPARYNSSSLLRRMEEENIGTKATRAGIIEILYRRGYVREARMRATPLANEVMKLLSQYCPLVTNVGFTSRLEELMEEIQQGKTTRALVLVEALQHLRPIMLDLVAEEDELGSRLADVVSAQKLADATFEHPCPDCGSRLKIVRNPRTRKRFVGCLGRWDRDCRFSLPLPQFGAVTILKRNCKACGFQMIQARSRGRRPLVSCPRCYVSRTARAASAYGAEAPLGTAAEPTRSG